MNIYEKVVNEVMALADEECAKHYMRFFKTGKGEYGENDIFLGLNTAQTKAIAKKYQPEITLAQTEKLLQNKHHEIRMVALRILIAKAEKCDLKEHKKILKMYLNNTKYVNNWDLVDVSATTIVGKYVFDTKDETILETLASSNHLWSERIAVVSTWYLLKRGEYSQILGLSERFLGHGHDLMHKAVGWMLREMGKMEIAQLYAFLNKHHKTMPRTMLRYSIEKLSPQERARYMKK